MTVQHALAITTDRTRLDRAERRAQEYIERYADDIRWVAAVLQERGRLTTMEVRAALEDHWPGQ